MEYGIKEKTIEAVVTSTTIDTHIDGTKLEVVIGDAAKMEVAQAVNYIESGKAEIEPLVIRAEEAAERAERYASTYIYEQAVASDTWVITHNLNKRPSVTVVDSSGNVFYPAVKYDSDNQCTATMNGATTGFAYLN